MTNMRYALVFGLCANMRRSGLKKFDFLSYEFGKGQYTFYPVKLSRFPKKRKFVGNTKSSQKGTLTKWVKCLSATSKVSSQTIF